ncbi:Glutaminase-asparaginase [Heracleum sosnowskyi]|uniref:Glutaminase-asparaginase n=1 Tax=Heracleum sosnowskyi TaxID=360622 RepID=A0AAD8ND95_9APIA|nr:Glutaminase-asparaginase [Heracleum sosnowskyi]
MGNCLALQQNLVQVMKTDGKILKYKAPMKVHQVLSEYSGHAISQTLQVTQHLRPDAELRAGQLYYLLPVPVSSMELEKEYSNTKGVARKENRGVVRIKLVIRKQDLEEMLSGGGTIEDVILQLQNNQLVDSFKNLDTDASKNSTGWKPVLPSIPEAC